MKDKEKSVADLSPERRELFELLKARKQAARKSTGRAEGPTPVDRSGPLPLSFSQQRLWFVDYLEPGNPAYNVPGALRLQGHLSLPALEASLNQVVKRHETLRTRFVAEGGQPRQVIRKNLRLSLPVVDLGRTSEALRERLVRRLAVEDNQRPYKLDQGPLLRALVVRLAERESVLLINMHHVIADNWSIGLFVQEAAELYEACVEDRAPVLSPLPCQYADFAVWQRQQLAGPVMESQLSYWLEVLGGELPVLELPTDRPRPAIQTWRGARHYLDLSPETTAAVKALARREATTPFVVGLTAFNLLLHRYLRQTDLPVGTTAAGRRHSGLESLLGLFMNLLVLRGDLSGEPTARQLLKRLHETTVGALAHQDLPFERVVDKLQVARDLSRSPIFQFQFNLQPATVRSMQRAGVVMTPLYLDSGTARFDMEMILWEAEAGLEGYMEYNLDLFDPTTMARLGRSFRQILQALLGNPDAPIHRVVGLTATESHQLLGEWNDTRRPELARESILPLIEAWAATAPEADAVVFEGRRLSYRELNQRANQLANLLRERGVGPEAVVGVRMERCPQMVVALLGILKAGGAYLPLEPNDPAERLRWMAADAGAAVVLAAEEAEPDPEIVPLDADWALLSEYGEDAPEPGITAASAAYVIYTSGSTGTPKGVVSCHGGLANRLLWMQEQYPLTPQDRVLQKTAFTFDVSVWEFFWPLMTGAALVLARPGGHRDAGYLARRIAEEEVTTLHFVPSMLRVFLEAPEVAGCGSLKRAILSGEALPEELARRFAERLPAAELHNLYGPTEAAIDVTAWPYRQPAVTTVAIGRPIANTRIYLMDPALRPVPPGVPGELCIGGAGLARGYLGRPGLTARSFVPDPLSTVGGQRLYRTGDLVRHLAGGEMEFLHRLDHQIKVRGFRIELGEIETHLLAHPAVEEGAVVVEQRTGQGPVRLVAAVVPGPDPGPDPEAELRSFLRERLPDYMVPALFVTVESLPRTSSGKIDRRALARLGPDRRRARPESAEVTPRSDTEQAVAEIWKEVLGVESVGVNENFFDVGGDSLLLAQVHARLRDSLGVDLPTMTLFRYTTIRSLADHLGQQGEEEGDHREGVERARMRSQLRREASSEIAIISMAVRLPGARSPEEFWRNLCAGMESVTFFTAAECLAAGADPELVADPNYVRAEAIIDDVEKFDSAFFGITPREAELIDPQQRFLLELGWEALERAGYGGRQGRGAVGVFSSAAMSAYLFNNLEQYRAVNIMTDFQTRVFVLSGNDKDFHAQKLSYLLKLNGPSLNVQTACSSALVAVHLGIQSLLAGECDMALAGGVQIRVPQGIGYLYQKDGLPSPDGHCRPFDAKAMGTIHSNGAGLVLLKRLPDALADGDPIHAVIKGSAVNNDADAKVGFTAPSLEGMVRVTAEALAVSGVDPATIGFVEAHGTGTDLGDTLEVEALSQVFRSYTEATEYCYMGSVKSNLGHLDTAAGVASLVKAVLALEHGRIPPTVHFETPNPKIPFFTTPFMVNAELAEWPEVDDQSSRRAAVNSFAIGGTNVHMVLEQAPPLPPGDPPLPWQLLLLSARTTTALDVVTSRLAEYLRTDSGVELADVAFTLQVGREGFPMRRAVVCRDAEDAVAALDELDPRQVVEDFYDGGSRPLTFLLPGELLDPHPWVGELMATEPTFRQLVEEGAELARPELETDLGALLGGQGESVRWSAPSAVTQAGLFVAQYALAGLWREWGVVPEALLGFGVGELVAACLGGAFSLPQALSLAVARGRALEQMPEGGSLVAERSFAAADSRNPSADPAPLVRAFARRLEDFEPGALAVAILSTVSGDWLSSRETADPDYWGRQLVAAPAVERALEALFERSAGVLLEVGDGAIPGSWLEDHPSCPVDQEILPSLERGAEGEPARAALLRGLGRLWTAGVEVDWLAVHRHETRRRVLLPTYPFERQTCWVEPQTALADQRRERDRSTDRDPARWFYTPTWKRRARPRPRRPPQEPCNWLVLGADEELGGSLCRRLAEDGHTVVPVSAGDAFAELPAGGYALRPDHDEDYEALLGELGAAEQQPRRIVHCWALAPTRELASESLLSLGRSLARSMPADPVTLHVLAAGIQEVVGGEEVSPPRAVVRGICRVLRGELPGLGCRLIELPENGGRAGLVEPLVSELGNARDEEVAYRGGYRWVRNYEPFLAPPAASPAEWLPRQPVVLLTRGANRAALGLAEDLATSVQARLAFVEGPDFPVPERWPEYLSESADESSTGRRVRALHQLQEQGARVLVLRADATDRARMAEAVARIGEELGPVDGVVHCARGPDGEVAADDAAGQRDVLERESRTLEVLTDVLGQQAPAFAFVLCDAESIFPGPNRLLSFSLFSWVQAFTERHNRTSRVPWQLVTMDSWDEGAAFAMTPAEGVKVWRRLLGQNDIDQVVVATGDLERRLQGGEEEEGPPAASLHARPQIGQDYVAPRDEMEQLVAQAWESVLGIGDVGVFDQFYDLGGNSLLATQLVSRLRDLFQTELPLRELLELGTVAAIADVLKQRQVELAGEDELESLLDELEEMPEEEAERIARLDT